MENKNYISKNREKRLRNFIYNLDYIIYYARDGLSDIGFLQQTPYSLEGSVFDSSSRATNYLEVDIMLNRQETIEFENYLLLNKGLRRKQE
jgi:hypothetical protein